MATTAEEALQEAQAFCHSLTRTYAHCYIEVRSEHGLVSLRCSGMTANVRYCDGWCVASWYGSSLCWIVHVTHGYSMLCEGMHTPDLDSLFDSIARVYCHGRRDPLEQLAYIKP